MNNSLLTSGNCPVTTWFHPHDFYLGLKILCFLNVWYHRESWQLCRSTDMVRMFWVTSVSTLHEMPARTERDQVSYLSLTLRFKSLPHYQLTKYIHIMVTSAHVSLIIIIGLRRCILRNNNTQLNDDKLSLWMLLGRYIEWHILTCFSGISCGTDNLAGISCTDSI